MLAVRVRMVGIVPTLLAGTRVSVFVFFSTKYAVLRDAGFDYGMQFRV